MSEPEKTPCIGTTKKKCESPAQFKVTVLNLGGLPMCKGCAEKTFRNGRDGAPVIAVVMFTSEIPEPT